MQSLLHYEKAETIYRYENCCNELISYSTREHKPIKIPGGSITIAIIAVIIFSFLEAFLKGKVLQVTIMAFVVGILIIKIGNRIANVKNLVTELNYLIFKIVRLIFSAIPVVIFLCVLKTLLTSSLSDFLKVWKIIVAELIIYAIIILLMMILLYVKMKVSIPDFLKKIAPAAMISLATFIFSVEIDSADNGGFLRNVGYGRKFFCF